MRVLLCFLLLFSSHYSMAAYSEQNNKLILVVGDSLSAGHGINPQRGWVSLLGQHIRQQGFDYRIINSSISGDTSANGLNRMSQLLESYQPHIVILELGGNDGLRGLSLGQMKKNLSAMIQQSQQKQAKVLLIGMQIPPNYGKRYTNAFHQIYIDLARQHEVVLLPFLLESIATDNSLMQQDGIHPNETAQTMIAENVWSYLRQMLQTGN